MNKDIIMIGIDGGIKNIGISCFIILNKKCKIWTTEHIKAPNFVAGLSVLQSKLFKYKIDYWHSHIYIAIEDITWVKTNAKGTTFAFNNYGKLKQQIGFVQGLSAIFEDFTNNPVLLINQQRVKHLSKSLTIKNPHERDAYAVGILAIEKLISDFVSPLN